MDWQLLIELLDVASRIITGLTLVGMFLLPMIFVTHRSLQHRFEQHDKVHDRINEDLGHGEVHFTRVDGELKHAPTHEDIEGLRRDIAELKSAVAAERAGSEERAARMERIEKAVDRLLDFHLNGGGK